MSLLDETVFVSQRAKGFPRPISVRSGGTFSSIRTPSGYSSVVFYGTISGDRFTMPLVGSRAQEDLEILAPETDYLDTRFRALADQWRNETMFDSGTSLFWNAAYQQIIGMGRPALPLILREMTFSPGHWFWALYCITGIDVAAGITNFDDAITAWLDWGAMHGII